MLAMLTESYFAFEKMKVFVMLSQTDSLDISLSSMRVDPQKGKTEFCIIHDPPPSGLSGCATQFSPSLVFSNYYCEVDQVFLVFLTKYSSVLRFA